MHGVGPDRYPRAMTGGPQIVLTVADPSIQAEPEIAERKNALYVDAIRRHGGDPVVLDATSAETDRRAAFATMAGLLLTGGADMDPARYRRPNQGSVGLEPDRDALEDAAYVAAAARGIPILGVCRGFQAINVFAGGTLLQDVGGHVGAGWGHGPAQEHALRLMPGSRLARILSPTNPRAGATTVNSYHHQAIRPTDLAPGLVANAWATSPEGELVEGFEAVDGRFVLGVQCHPERKESTPDSFERLWRFFVDACRGPISAR
jgi:putative glutamine amidotransferase